MIRSLYYNKHDYIIQTEIVSLTKSNSANKDKTDIFNSIIIITLSRFTTALADDHSSGINSLNGIRLRPI